MSDIDTNESSYTYPMPPSELRKDGLIVISDYACKIYEIEESQGAFTIKATDIFSGWKHKCVISSDDTADVPHVSSTEYELTSIDDGILSLMAPDGTPKEDIEVPRGDLGSNIYDLHDGGRFLRITVQKVMGKELAVSYEDIGI